MYDDKTFLGIIPARSGSKRLPDKNKRHLAGKPLICWSIEAGMNSQYLDQIVLTTDDEDILDIANAYDIKTIKRPEKLASDTATTFSAIEHAIDKIEEQYDYIVLLQPTSPLRNEKHIDEAVEYLNYKGADAVISVCEMDHPPQLSNTLPENRSMAGFLSEEVKGKRSQDMDQYYRLNGAIYICNLDRFQDEQTIFIKNRIYAYIMDSRSSIDIDEKIDFEFGKYLINSAYLGGIMDREERKEQQKKLYQDYDKKFLEEFSYYKNKYPNAFILLEENLRFAFATKNNQKNTLPFCSGVRFLFKKLYRFWVLLFTGFKKKFTNSKGNVYFFTTRFFYLEKKLQGYLHKKLGDYNLISNRGSFFDFLKLGCIDINAVVLSTFWFYRVYKKINKIGINQFLHDDKLMQDLEKKAKKEIELASKLISRLNVKLVINEQDASPNCRVLIEASKQNSICYYVIAHGYFQGGFLITILPVFADKLFVWTRGQERMLKERSEHDQASQDKIVYAGYPYSLNVSHSKACNNKQALIVLGPFGLLAKRSRLGYTKGVEVLNEYINALQYNGYSVKVRPKHRKDKKHLASDLLCEVDNSAYVEQDLNNSKIVLFAFTSVGIQSVLLNIPTFQITEFGVYDFDFVKDVDIEEFKSILKENKERQCGLEPDINELEAETILKTIFTHEKYQN